MLKNSSIRLVAQNLECGGNDAALDRRAFLDVFGCTVHESKAASLPPHSKFSFFRSLLGTHPCSNGQIDKSGERRAPSNQGLQYKKVGI